MARPELTRRLLAEDFCSFYWLKEELLVFCRENGLSPAGSKKDLALRVETFLATGGSPATEAVARRSTVRMPGVLSRETVIGAGWRCSQELRAFFEREIGPSFHFDGVMRDFIKNGAGRTLQEALDAWETAQKQPVSEKEIAPQFEYNRHIREYFKEHPGATLAEAIQTWKEKRAQRRS